MYSPNNVDYLHSKGLDEQYNAIKYICNMSSLLQKVKGDRYAASEIYKVVSSSTSKRNLQAWNFLKYTDTREIKHNVKTKFICQPNKYLEFLGISERNLGHWDRLYRRNSAIRSHYRQQLMTGASILSILSRRDIF